MARSQTKIAVKRTVEHGGGGLMVGEPKSLLWLMTIIDCIREPD